MKKLTAFIDAVASLFESVTIDHLMSEVSNLSDELTEEFMKILVPVIILFQQLWEHLGWKGMDYAVFERLVRMFPAPCQELYPLWRTPDDSYVLLVFKRPEADKYYAGMYHNPGTAHRSTDSLNVYSIANELGMKTVPARALEAAKASPTWDLDARGIALFRVLTGGEIGLDEASARAALASEIEVAGSYPMQMTPRGPESAILNVWVMNDAQVKDLKMRDYMTWVDVRDICVMGKNGKFLFHQINRVAMMIDYVREHIDSSAPVLDRITV